MITPRQVNQIYASIEKHGLTRQRFELAETEKGIQIQYLKTRLYFSVSQRDKDPSVTVITVTDAVRNLANLYMGFSIEHFPSLLPYSATPSLPIKQLTTDWDNVLHHLNNWLTWIKKEYGPFVPPNGIAPSLKDEESALIHLHPTVQSSATSLFASAHYPQAILAACTALDKAVQAKAQLPASTVGTALMTKAFSANQPIIRLAQDANEQMGFMNLYQGSVQAIRNHYAHNLTEIPVARALEWLSFLSALFYKLDEAQPINVPIAP
jgi:uncharacterized protein (TIGR02391 family)